MTKFPPIIKLSARNIMKSRTKVFLLALVYLAFGVVISMITSELSGYNEYYEKLYNAAMAGFTGEIPFPEVEPVAAILASLSSIMQIPLSAGFNASFVKVVRGEEFSVKNIFDGFEFFLRSIAISVLSGLLTVLGFILFIIPGFIMAYKFRLSILLMFDNPDKGAIWCLKESARLMKGHKIELFLLDFSFFGWYIAESLIALYIPIPILDIYLSPYIGLSSAIFYEALINPEFFRIHKVDIPGTPGDSDDSGNNEE